MTYTEKHGHILMYIFITVAVVGLLDSIYLAYSYYSGTPLSCELIAGCNEVAQSPYSYIAGISLPTIGIVYYLFTISNAVYHFVRRTTLSVTILSFLTTLGLFVSIYFVYLQIYIIGAICIYCMGSAISATILFILGVLMRRHHVREHEDFNRELEV